MEFNNFVPHGLKRTPNLTIAAFAHPDAAGLRERDPHAGRDRRRVVAGDEPDQRAGRPGGVVTHASQISCEPAAMLTASRRAGVEAKIS